MTLKAYRRHLDLKAGHVDLSHGSGGRAMAQLIKSHTAARYGT